MKLNENTAVSTADVLLVPYDRHHVLTYHQWMEDPAIREATASDRLTLAAEYENQASWRASHDKLTFIICQSALSLSSSLSSSVESGVVDAPARMVGDINLFIHPHDDNDDDDDDSDEGSAYVAAEIDVMVAAPEHRGKGVGTAAVAAFLRYVRSNLEGILAEHLQGSGSTAATLKLFMVKIKADNDASIALFRRLGFEQDGPVNYFGEIKMVLRDVDGVAAGPPPPGYREVEYRRGSVVAGA